MTDDAQLRRAVLNKAALPEQFPTHHHPGAFWEALGRAVATFGFLEDALGRAIYAFSGSREVAEEDVAEELPKFLALLKRSLSDPLGALIESYGKAVRTNPKATLVNLEEFLADLRAASRIRNVLCHGAWLTPDDNGRTIPRFFNNKDESFETPIDVDYLDTVQRHAAELACEVINTVTHMGYQFPGGAGPGVPL